MIERFLVDFEGNGGNFWHLLTYIWAVFSCLVCEKMTWTAAAKQHCTAVTGVLWFTWTTISLTMVVINQKVPRNIFSCGNLLLPFDFSLVSFHSRSFSQRRKKRILAGKISISHTLVIKQWVVKEKLWEKWGTDEAQFFTWPG